MAQQAAALLGHFQMSERDVDYGVLAVVRVLDALKASQPMVGGPLNVARITPEGVHHLDPDEIAGLRDHVERWEEADQRALDSLFEGDPWPPQLPRTGATLGTTVVATPVGSFGA